MTAIVGREALHALRDRLTQARRILVLTGAGISAGSGLATFRGPGGIYTDTELEQFHHAEHLPTSLGPLWGFWGPMRSAVRAARPSAAHHALAAWLARQDAAGAQVTVVTQNVDDLHERAGTATVHHLHGRLYATRCLDERCGTRIDPDEQSSGQVPRCPSCAGPMRPDMVLFGEPVDLPSQWAAKRAVRDCDAFLAVGTSGTVAPASNLVRYASDVGALTVCIDPAAQPSAFFTHHVPLVADEVLPILLAG